MKFIRSLSRERKAGYGALAGGVMLLGGAMTHWVLSGMASRSAAADTLAALAGALLLGAATALLRRGSERAAATMREMERAGQFSTFVWEPKEERLRWSQRPRFLSDDRPFPAWAEILHAADRETTLKAFEELASVAADYEVEFRVKQPDGTCRWLLLRATSVAGGGRRHAVAGALIDITEHCQAEELVRETALEVVVNDLASSLGDTINNSLAALTNTMYLLQRDAHLNTATKQYLLEMAMVELARLGRVSKNMLGLSGEEKGADDVAHPTFTLDLRPDLRS